MRRLRPLTRRDARDREGGRRPPSRFWRRRAAVVAAFVVAAGASAAVLTAWSRDNSKPEPQAKLVTGRVTLAAGGEGAVPWASENRIRLARARATTLAATTNATLIGTLAPIVVPAPAGRSVAYNSWRGRRPVLRIRDRGRRRDAVLAEGAHSAAWRRDGALAYFEAASPELRDPRRYVGHIVVRASVGSRARPWTRRAGRYVVAAWARRSVIAYRLGTGFPDLLVVDAQARQRVLARGSALVALSPDGRRAFVTRYGATPAVVSVVEIASGRELARLRVEPGAAGYVIESGSWVGDRVFAATTTGIAVFRVAGNAIRVDRVLRMEHEFPGGVAEARAADDAQRVAAWGELPSQPRQAIAQAALVDCDVETFRCVRVAVTSSAAPPRPIYNPSRP